MSARCRSCQDEVIWTQSANGKAMPLNATPDPKGRYYLVPPSDPREDPLAVNGTAPPGAPRFTSHFATCPNAATHRRAR